MIFAGSISLVIGAIGILVPGLPTTTFLLITAACYVRSSEKLYSWLINHKVFGKFIRDYQMYKAMPMKSKVIALVSMWTMISLSTILFVHSLVIDIVIIVCGIIGTIIIYRVKTLNEQTSEVRDGTNF